MADSEGQGTITVPLLFGASLVLEIDGTDALGMLDELQGNAKDTSPLWREIGEWMRGSFAVKFATHGLGSWAPLKPATLRRKIARGFPPDTLVETGALKSSYLDPDAEGHIEETTDGGLGYVIGSDYKKTVENRPAPPEKPKAHELVAQYHRRPRLRGVAASTQVPLAAIHHHGSPKTHLPARPVAEVEASDLDYIAKAALRWFTGERDASSVPDDATAFRS